MGGEFYRPSYGGDYVDSFISYEDRRLHQAVFQSGHAHFPETNSSSPPENRPKLPQKEMDHLPTIDFQGRTC